jgi:hypothetical protein
MARWPVERKPGLVWEGDSRLAPKRAAFTTVGVFLKVSRQPSLNTEHVIVVKLQFSISDLTPKLEAMFALLLRERTFVRDVEGGSHRSGEPFF